MWQLGGRVISRCQRQISLAPFSRSLNFFCCAYDRDKTGVFISSTLTVNRVSRVSIRLFTDKNGAGIDWSRYPTVEECDLEERFVRGSGPGGQSVNKTANCVSLCHAPSGVRVKCHESRSLETNRRRAREMLLEKLDEHINKDMSVSQQKLRLQQARDHKKQQQRRQRQLRKLNWLQQRDSES